MTILAYFGLAAVVGLINWFSPDQPAAEQVVDVMATSIEEDEALPIAA